ncbi:FkbM family methyltransferase [Halorientalis marina]|uniref:FkbM family methyltransferase n=1 Tax=Halorientalis marina TaxID=2931976 RepID=UPI001FF47F11|nr:FkbM family methyltransferase [Halorientalis marina]
MSLSRAADVYRRDGAIALLKKAVPYAYNQYIRCILPRRGSHPEFNEVKVGGVYGPYSRVPRLFDRIVPWSTPDIDHMPDYEDALLDAVRAHVREGDDVVIIGGGNGVSTVVAAQRVGPPGTVTTYEGNGRKVTAIENTIALNEVGDRTEVQQAIVGPSIGVVGSDHEFDAATRLSSSEIPDCDVLEMDCEGSEKEILETLPIRPSRIIVETHPEYEAPQETIRQLLTEMGYRITNETPVVPEMDIHILSAAYDD